MLADRLFDAYEFSPWREKYTAHFARGSIATHQVILIKPQTFMNKTGLPIAQFLRFFKLEARQLLVVHDELDLARGKIRLKYGGGSGGHNGLKDIDRHIGSDYWRLRIGIGRPPLGQDADKHVLANFTAHDHTWLNPLIDSMLANWGVLYNSDNNSDTMDEAASRFMNAVALKKETPHGL